MRTGMRHGPRESPLRYDFEPSGSHHPGKIKELQKLELFYFAERGGFEPPVRFPVRMFSKHVVSATHPPLRGFFTEFAFVTKCFVNLKKIHSNSGHLTKKKPVIN